MEYDVRGHVKIWGLAGRNEGRRVSDRKKIEESEGQTQDGNGGEDEEVRLANQDGRAGQDGGGADERHGLEVDEGLDGERMVCSAL